jgi:hypothetical protein
LKTLRYVAFVVLAVWFVACIGCGGSGASLSSSPSQGRAQYSSQGQAQTAIHFAIPIHAPGSQFSEGTQQAPYQQALSKGAQAKFANGNFDVFLDNRQIVSANFTPTWVAGVLQTGPGPSGEVNPTPDGGSITYTSEITTTEIDVTVNLTTTAGPLHTIGVVQTNGDCVNTDGDPCLSTQPGYVLAEGQTQFTLNPDGGTPNLAINLTLQGVLQSGYICPTGSMSSII